MQDLDILGKEGLFFFCTLLRISRQGISSSISLVLIIIDTKVVTRKFLGPADLPRAQTLRVYEPTEFVVVDKHKNFMSRAL